MKCPKCRSEVGNLSACPYCGATVYVSGAWDMNDRARRTTVPVSALGGRLPMDSHIFDKRLRNLENRVNLLLVLQSGSFLLLMLVLLMLALN